ncbi:lecithin retinol acyltransferase family protein [Burkholderia stagnalis]|uniref:lecithin retinol acyltransferase family protein n=1 Tax=Burkholderia stagnalis TaxID=1503054 RepID=UPI0018C849FF|nr:lecithin retinol acyltransferase family protein [Burkholderia stagnalis]
MNCVEREQDIWSYRAGTVVRVNHGWYDHVGMLGDRLTAGERSVLSFSAQAGGFIEEPFSEFARGQDVKVDGFPSNLHPMIVMQRARSMEGHRYSLTNLNCEHFVRHAHATTVQSPQLQMWTLFGSALGLLAIAARV